MYGNSPSSASSPPNMLANDKRTPHSSFDPDGFHLPEFYVKVSFHKLIPSLSTSSPLLI